MRAASAVYCRAPDAQSAVQTITTANPMKMISRTTRPTRTSRSYPTKIEPKLARIESIASSPTARIATGFVTGDERDAHAIMPSHDAEAVVFVFVNPIRLYWRLLGAEKAGTGSIKREVPIRNMGG